MKPFPTVRRKTSFCSDVISFGRIVSRSTVMWKSTTSQRGAATSLVCHWH